MRFEDVLGCEVDFYGVDNNAFKLGSDVFEAIEDPDDGYRSYLRSVEVRDVEGLIFFERPLARVRVIRNDDGGRFDGYSLVDVVEGHTWLRFGTDDLDDYYPSFRFEYVPLSAGLR